MKDLSLIEKFENKPFQDVGTFNSIFKHSPILGFSADTPVEIKEMNPNQTRRVMVGDKEIFIQIYQPNMVHVSDFVKIRKEKIKRTQYKKESKTQTKSLPNFFKQLNATEFKIYEAIKFLKFVDGVEELSKQIFISRKTVSNKIKRLEKLGLIFTEMIALNGRTVLRLHIKQ